MFILDHNDYNDHSDSLPGTSKPVHVQRVEKALDLTLFLQNINKVSNSSDSDDSDDITNINDINSESILKGKQQFSNNFTSNHNYFRFRTKLHEGLLQFQIGVKQ